MRAKFGLSRVIKYKLRSKIHLNESDSKDQINSVMK